MNDKTYFCEHCQKVVMQKDLATQRVVISKCRSCMNVLATSGEIFATKQEVSTTSQCLDIESWLAEVAVSENAKFTLEASGDNPSSYTWAISGPSITTKCCVEYWKNSFGYCDVFLETNVGADVIAADENESKVRLVCAAECTELHICISNGVPTWGVSQALTVSGLHVAIFRPLYSRLKSSLQSVASRFDIAL